MRRSAQCGLRENVPAGPSQGLKAVIPGLHQITGPQRLDRTRPVRRFDHRAGAEAQGGVGIAEIEIAIVFARGEIVVLVACEVVQVGRARG